MKFGPLTVRALPGDRWRLVEPMPVELAPEIASTPYKGGKVVVPKGFETDFASIPNLVRGLLDEDSERPAVLHDYLYQVQSVPKAVADKIFRVALAAEGVGKSRRWVMWAAVRIFGDFDDKEEKRS